MYTPHTVTIFNAHEDPDFTLRYSVTVLEGVFLDTTTGAGNSNTGAQGQNSASLYIPFSVKATDAVTGERKKYVPGITFHALDWQGDAWTLEGGGENSGIDCYYIKGRVNDVIDVENDAIDYDTLRGKFPDVYAVQSVRTCDYGSKDMQHWAVTSR